jgi:hypothetical protein
VEEHYRVGRDFLSVTVREEGVMKIFDSTPSFEEWCGANGLDPDDDENYNAYCEWKANCG